MSRPLNGLEIRTAFLKKVEAQLDRIPMLGENLSYYGFEAEIGYSFKSFPEDVPIPPAGEIGPFLVMPPAAEIQAEITKYIDNIARLKEIRNRIDSILAAKLVEDQGVVGLDGNIPDKVRVDAGMPPAIDRPFNPLSIEPKPELLAAE